MNVFFAWVENDGALKDGGCMIDPFLTESLNLSDNTMMPMPTTYIFAVKDTIVLDKTLDELKQYWKQSYNIVFK